MKNVGNLIFSSEMRQNYLALWRFVDKQKNEFQFSSEEEHIRSSCYMLVMM